MHLQALVDRQSALGCAHNLRVLRQGHQLASQVHLITAHVVYVALKHHATHLPHILARRLHHQTLGVQDMSVPATAHQHFCSRHGVTGQTLSVKPYANTLKGQTHGIHSGDAPRQLRLRLRRNRLQARGHHLARGQTLSADLHPITNFEPGHIKPITRAHGLAHHLQGAGAAVQATNGADQNVHHSNVERRELISVARGPHGDQLPHCQVARRAALSIGKHRRAGVVMQFQTIYANACKAGDHTHNAGAAHTTTSGAIDTGAAHTTTSGAIDPGAADTTIADACAANVRPTRRPISPRACCHTRPAPLTPQAVPPGTKGTDCRPTTGLGPGGRCAGHRVIKRCGGGAYVLGLSFLPDRQHGKHTRHGKMPGAWLQECRA